jgi:hypothetical protein
VIRKTAELCPNGIFRRRASVAAAYWGHSMREARRFRANAIFADALANATPLDRNGQARVLFIADMLERRSKLPGKRNGVLGYIGVMVLRVLVLRCLNRKSGLCCPSYAALQSMTGLCRGSIATALSRLEASGLVKIVRRLVRKAITRVSPITGHQQLVVTTLQDTNAYSFSNEPNPIPVPTIAAPARPFPARRVAPPQQAVLPLELSLENRESPVQGIKTERPLSWREAARKMLSMK